MTNPCQLSIITVTYNSKNVLEPFVASLIEALPDFEVELIFVDNGSTDGSPEQLRSGFSSNKYMASAQIIKNERNTGFARAANRGAAAARGAWLLFLNPDLILDSDSISQLLEKVSAERKVGLVSGRVRNSDGSFQATCRELPTYSNLLFSRGSALGRFLGGGGRYTLGDFDRVTEVPAVAGTMLMARKESFEQLGRFDERFFMYMEDTDLSRRATEAGLRNLFLPEAGAVHHWGGSSPTGWLRRRYYHHRSLWQYFLKHRRGLFSLVVLPVLLILHFGLTIIIRPGRV